MCFGFAVVAMREMYVMNVRLDAGHLDDGLRVRLKSSLAILGMAGLASALVGVVLIGDYMRG